MNNRPKLSRFDRFVKKSLTSKKIFGIDFSYLSLWVFTTFFLSAIFSSSLVLWGWNLFFRYPKIVYSYPAWESTWNEYDKPIDVVFDRPIDVNSLKLNINPQTQGRWEYKKPLPFLPFVREIKFYPSETIYPGYEVMVYFTHITNYFNTIDNREELIKFNSVEVPKIVSSSPAIDTNNVGPDQEIEFNLSHKEGSYVDWEFVTNHKDKTFSIKRDNSDKIKFKFDDPMIQGDDYVIKVYVIPLAKDLLSGETSTSAGEKKLAYTLKFKTVSTPFASSFSPQGNGIGINSNVVIKFADPMNKQSVEKSFNISPKVDGVVSWQDPQTFVFKPNSLSKDTSYTVRLESGFKSEHGGISDKLISFRFKTIGKVEVTGWSPSNSSNEVKRNVNFRITFNQEVDHLSAEEHLKLEPNIVGSIKWEGNTLVFDPANDLEYFTKYTMTVSAGVKSIKGLDSDRNFQSSFSTEVKKVLLNVPLRKQVYSKECQVVATQMLLAFKGIVKSSTQIFNELPKQTTPCNATNNTWGDPNLGFVGERNGNHDCASGYRGYGIYWNPISNYLSSNGVANQVHTGWSIQGVTKAIDEGHPVMLWWQNGWSTPDDVSWKTPEGKYIHAVNGTHSEIVVGYIGNADNPTHFIINDPWRQRRTMDVNTFKGLWSYHNNTAIEVM